MHGEVEGLYKVHFQKTCSHLFRSKPGDQYYHAISLNGGMTAVGFEVSFNVLVKEFVYPVERRMDKPKPLKKKAFESDGSVTWTAAMTLTFLLNATLILSAHVDTQDPVVQCFFMHCFYVSFAWYKETWTWDDVVYLDKLVNAHHKLFAELWPDCTIPKFHWVLHMALDVWRCGPIRHITCFRCEAKHQYFKKLVSQLNWIGNVPLTMARRHSRHSALHFYREKLSGMSSSAVVVVGTCASLSITMGPACEIPLLFQVPAIIERTSEHIGAISVVQHTVWKYCGHIVQNGTTLLFVDAEGKVAVAVVERLFELSSVYVVTYRQFACELVVHNGHMVLPDEAELGLECAMEMNTNQMSVAHRCMVSGKCHILHV